jgi:hypothetical protein
LNTVTLSTGLLLRKSIYIFIIIFIIINITAIQLSLGVTGSYTTTDRKNKINIFILCRHECEETITDKRKRQQAAI